MSIFDTPTNIKRAYTDSHIFTVGGENDLWEVHCNEDLGGPATVIEIRNNEALIDIYIRFDYGSGGYSNPFKINGGDVPFRIYYEDGVSVYNIQLWASAINGACEVYAAPGIEPMYQRIDTLTEAGKKIPTSRGRAGPRMGKGILEPEEIEIP